MSQFLKLSIEEPCHESRDNMYHTEQGQFCSTCSKEVIDFTHFTNKELKNYFQNHPATNTCGRFYKKQLTDLVIEVPSYVLTSNSFSWQQRFLLCIFIGFASTLFVCTDVKGQTHKQTTVEIVDTAKKTATPIRTKEGLPKENTTPMVTGLITYQPPQDGTLAHPYKICDKMPEYPNGKVALKRFIDKYLQYPSLEKQNRIEAIVEITCIIDSTGKITTPFAAYGTNEALGKEALRMVNKMPKWIPGTQAGKKVNVEITIPIEFKLHQQ